MFFLKQKTAYEMRISDWSSDVCSSDLGDWREVLEPVLRLHETLDVLAHRAGVDVMGDHQEQGLVDILLVDLLQHLVLLGGIEGVAHLVEQFVHLLVAVMAPVGAIRRHQVALQMADQAGEGVLDEVGEVDAGGAMGAFGRGTSTPQVDQLVPLNHLELDLEDRKSTRLNSSP